ncbi:MAG TPA: alpha-ketoacid dehydrogenase subunit beta [Candidatus Caldiarchaeum subterraneum]|uniref:Alpha-ketoacid dehydrogenase subunit beta n=1 Tax=Caldiarchaeum subterraneum TaxID=311458 RepID=A0A832ZX15_CALS0|nr:alpha-ketoacid dehydrogenase subunit beta [Candidatus Caldarchaeum subterraneum]
MANITLAQAVNQALREEMRRDDRVIVLGEDVGKRGGVFLCTEGLYEEFGPERVIDTPLSESAIIGAALGMAMYGLRPVAEIQFADFIYGGFEQIVSNVAKIRYRSGGQFGAPMVIRAPYGGGVKGGMYHSQSPEAYFAHTAGLKVVIPSTPYDTKGLLITSIRDEDPVVFFEPKRIYRAVREEVPEGDYTVPIGVARVAREGDDVSILTYGACVYDALAAADKAEKEGISVEVIDLRTLVPFDKDAVVKTVRKTGRPIIVHEAPKLCGFGAELSAFIAEREILSLQAPILRVTGFDTPFPLVHEHLYLPNENRIFKAIKKSIEF